MTDYEKIDGNGYVLPFRLAAGFWREDEPPKKHKVKFLEEYFTLEPTLIKDIRLTHWDEHSKTFVCGITAVPIPHKWAEINFN